MDDDKKKQGSGKSPTKFMERPGTKKPEKKESGSEQGHPEFINDDLDALENQEKDEEKGWQNQDWNKGKPKGDEKSPPKKSPETDKRDSSSGDTGDCACP